MSAHCNTCGNDIVYPKDTWPIGICPVCEHPAVEGLILAWRWLRYFTEATDDEPEAPVLEVWRFIEQAVRGPLMDELRAKGYALDA